MKNLKNTKKVGLTPGKIDHEIEKKAKTRKDNRKDIKN